MATGFYGEWRPEVLVDGGCLGGEAQPDSTIENIPSELGTIYAPRLKTRYDWGTGTLEVVEQPGFLIDEKVDAMGDPAYPAERRSAAYPTNITSTLGETALGARVEDYQTPPDQDAAHYGSVTDVW